MKNLLIIISAGILLLVYNSCKKNETKCIDGNADIIQDQRDLDPFVNVAVIGAFLTSIDQTQSHSVDLFAESNIVPIIRTDVGNEQLRVIVQDGNCYNTNLPVEIHIHSPDYEIIQSDGSGDISLNNLDLDELTFNLNGSGNANAILDIQNFTLSNTGSGNATIVGNGNRGDYVNSGSGNIYASNYFQESAYLVSSGSGDVHIYATETLDVVLTGSGNVYYKGNPANINQNITGSGQLINEGK